MSDPLHKRMFRKWGKDRCELAYRYREQGLNDQHIRDKIWPYGNGGTARSVRTMINAWREWRIIRACAESDVPRRSVIVR